MASTSLNKRAGTWLREVREMRKKSERSAPRFAKLLSKQLAPATVSAGALYAWETGERTVPGPVLLAASRITGIPVALDEVAKKTLTDEVAEAILGHLREKGLDV